MRILQLDSMSKGSRRQQGRPRVRAKPEREGQAAGITALARSKPMSSHWFGGPLVPPKVAEKAEEAPCTTRSTSKHQLAASELFAGGTRVLAFRSRPPFVENKSKQNPNLPPSAHRPGSAVPAANSVPPDAPT